MERGNLGKWLFLAVAVALFMIFGYPKLFGSSVSERQPLKSVYVVPEKRGDDKRCTLEGDRFSAEISSHDGTLRSFRMADPKYAKHVNQPETRIDLVTPDLLESRAPMRTDLRLPGDASEDDQQVAFDALDYELTASDASSCTFTYQDANTRVTKKVALTERAFELDVTLTVENIGTKARKHRLTIEQGAWRTKTETAGSWGRLPEYDTQTVLRTKDKTERHRDGDFAPKDFAKKEFTAEKWLRASGDGVWAAVSSSYFSALVIHEDGPATPAAEALVEEAWNVSRYPKKDDDPSYGHVYRARLTYPEEELQPGGSLTYRDLVFMGPKERNVLASVGGAVASGEGTYKTTELRDMSVFIFGNLFSGTLGKLLLAYVYWLAHAVGSWGLAIILLTITVKLLVYPLSLFGLKNSVAMRRIRPQMDAINKQYPDDMMQRNVATQELMRREKVSSPMLGCLPGLLQMPIWLTLYAALRSSVEVYHQPFGPLIPDLSEPGRFYVIPIVLGASSFLQQKLMQQSMPQADPQQAKMMLIMMPAVFTIMNVFMPAGLGVYMLTNTWLGIIQTLFVERYIRSKLGPPGAGAIEVREKTSAALEKRSEKKPKTAPSVAVLGKGKASARG